MLSFKKENGCKAAAEGSICLLRYTENQGWTETVTGILWSPKATVAHVVTQERSSTETGMSWHVTCHQTWWTFWAAWPYQKKFLQDRKKLQRRFNLQLARQGVPGCPSHQPITISRESDTSPKCMSKAKNHEVYNVCALYPSYPVEELLLLS